MCEQESITQQTSAVLEQLTGNFQSSGQFAHSSCFHRHGQQVSFTVGSSHMLQEIRPRGCDHPASKCTIINGAECNLQLGKLSLCRVIIAAVIVRADITLAKYFTRPLRASRSETAAHLQRKMWCFMGSGNTKKIFMHEFRV
jgi:hypothetical protein